MLLQMGIRNFALIEEMNLKFDKGITIFTGETGAGKSILMDAFSILLGERASNEFIRQGKDSFIINGLFDLENNVDLVEYLKNKNILLEDNTLILSRSFSRQGKTTILVNDQPITLKTLKEIGSFLADIHGQYSNQLLLDEKIHYKFLDNYNKEGKEAYQNYYHAYSDYKTAVTRLEELTSTSLENARELDMLKFQIDEIENAALLDNEDKNIAEELQRLDNFEHINKVLTSSYDAFYEGRSPLLDSINTIKTEIKDLVRYDGTIKDISELMDSAYFQLEEAAQSVDRYKDSISYDEERYTYCQQRDSLIYELKRKYGDSIEAIKEYENKAQKRLEELENLTYEVSDLENNVKETQKLAEDAHSKLAKIRQKNSAEISKFLKNRLCNLGMEKAILQFNIIDSNILNSLGAEKIELLFSANTGEDLLPLHKIASGGEISRIALAFKSIFNADHSKTLVFDEIDVGISGDIALKVAEQIQSLGVIGQVFCITHLPQTASVADYHYHLKKEEKDGRTISTIVALTPDDHLKQIAQMMSGNTFSTTAMNTAKEMVNHFKNTKN